MKQTFIIVYKPYKGKELELLPAVKACYQDLVKNKYATNDPPKIMRADDESIIIVFDWMNEQMDRKASEDPIIQHHWMKLAKLCAFEKPMNIAEFQRPFSTFETIDPD